MGYLLFFTATSSSIGIPIIINVKTKAIMKIMFAIFRIFQKFISRQSEIGFNWS